MRATFPQKDGDFFSAKSPQELAAGFSSAIAQISSRNVAPTTAAVNASVVTAGALSFSTGYNTGDWSGTFWAVSINSDGTVDTKPADAHWKAETTLNADFHVATGASNYSTRKVYTDTYTLTTDASGAVTSATFNDGFQFTAANAASLDSVQTAGLESPALSATDTDHQRATLQTLRQRLDRGRYLARHATDLVADIDTERGQRALSVVAQAAVPTDALGTGATGATAYDPLSAVVSGAESAYDVIVRAIARIVEANPDSEELARRTARCRIVRWSAAPLAGRFRALIYYGPYIA